MFIYLWVLGSSVLVFALMTQFSPLAAAITVLAIQAMFLGWSGLRGDFR